MPETISSSRYNSTPQYSFELLDNQPLARPDQIFFEGSDTSSVSALLFGLLRLVMICSMPSSGLSYMNGTEVG